MPTGVYEKLFANVSEHMKYHRIDNQIEKKEEK